MLKEVNKRKTSKGKLKILLQENFITRNLKERKSNFQIVPVKRRRINETQREIRNSNNPNLRKFKAETFAILGPEIQYYYIIIKNILIHTKKITVKEGKEERKLFTAETSTRSPHPGAAARSDRSLRLFQSWPVPSHPPLDVHNH